MMSKDLMSVIIVSAASPAEPIEPVVPKRPALDLRAWFGLPVAGQPRADHDQRLRPDEEPDDAD